MSRLSQVGNLTRGFLRFRPRHLVLAHRQPVRWLSDDSDSSSVQQVVSQLKRAEMEKPSAQNSHRLVWPDVHGNDFTEGNHDGFTATWDFKNNELDVEQLAGLPGPSRADDPYTSSEHEEDTCDDYHDEEEEQHQKLLEELQFGRMLALRGHLNREFCSPEPFPNDKLSSLDSVCENVEFMMQELSQISFMLRTLCLEQDNANVMSQENCVLENAYVGPEFGSWVCTQPSVNPIKELADVSDAEDVLKELQEELENSVLTSEGEPQLISDQETKALDEVITADESPKNTEVITADESPRNTPPKPSRSTPSPDPNPSPRKDARQVPEPQETIPSYRPFRTIEVPAPRPSRDLCSEVNAEPVPDQQETVAEGRAEISPMEQGFALSAQLSESESRFLMQLALKQALSDLESGKTNYKATLLMAKDVESHGVD